MFKNLLVAVVALLCVSVRASEDGWPKDHPLRTLKPGCWYEVPDSTLLPHVPKPQPPGRYGSIMGAWSGGAYDTTEDRLIVTGGGHNDYGGNELYAFDVKTLKWSRIWGPSKDIPAIQNKVFMEAYADGNPAQRHTYDGLEYLPKQHRFWVYGGSLHHGGGWAGKATWEFDFKASKWHRTEDCPGGGSFPNVTGYDPVTGWIWMAGNPGRVPLYAYDPATGKWTKRGDDSAGAGKDGAIDYKRRLFVAVGMGGVFAYKLSAEGNIKRQKLETAGDQAIVESIFPGWAYDPVADKMVGWCGGADIYALDLDKMEWTKHEPASENKVTPTPAAKNGTFGRFQYIPAMNAYIVVNAVDQNVYLYRLTEKPKP